MIDFIYFNFIYFLAFFVGFAIKQLDFIIDVERREPSPLDLLILVLLGGVGVGILLSSVSPFASVAFAVFLAQPFSGKLDDKSYWILAVLAVIVAYILGIPHINPYSFIFFFLAALLDEVEWGNKILEARPFLPLASIIWFFVYGDLTCFLGVASFDLGYHLSYLINKSRYILLSLPRIGEEIKRD